MPFNNTFNGEIDWLSQLNSNGEIPEELKELVMREKYARQRQSSRQKIGRCFVCETDIFDGDQVFRYGMRDESGERSKIYCGKCANSFKRCCQCKASFKVEDLFMEHCPYCVEEAPQRLIRNYSTKVHRELPMLGKSLDGLYFGVEVEFESDNFGRDTLVTNELVKGFAMLKKDSSIKKGFEVVSAPGTQSELEYRFRSLFDRMPRSVHPDTTCGMHVHVTRVRLSDLQIGKMLVFIHNPENEKFITAVAGRASSFHNDFKRAKRIGEGLFGGANQEHKDRHTALNLNNENTIEFRIFASTRDSYVFSKNIEFCKALVKFTDWAQYSVSEAKSFKCFYDFVKRERKEYENLWKFLTNAKIFATLRE